MANLDAQSWFRQPHQIRVVIKARFTAEMKRSLPGPRVQKSKAFQLIDDRVRRASG